MYVVNILYPSPWPYTQLILWIYLMHVYIDGMGKEMDDCTIFCSCYPTNK